MNKKYIYKKPTEEMIQNAIDSGWKREDAERGYTIFDFDGTGLLEIERIEDVYDCAFGYDVVNESCAVEAERSGYCKIIPVEELPARMIYAGASRRWYGWVDTPENRKKIEDYFKAQNL